MGLFCGNSWQLKFLNYFRKNCHRRYLTGFWICLLIRGVIWKKLSFWSPTTFHQSYFLGFKILNMNRMGLLLRYFALSMWKPENMVLDNWFCNARRSIFWLRSVLHGTYHSIQSTFPVSKRPSICTKKNIFWIIF